MEAYNGTVRYDWGEEEGEAWGGKHPHRSLGSERALQPKPESRPRGLSGAVRVGQE